MSVGCRIIQNFPRPTPETVERFRGMAVANIDDCMGRIAAVEAAIEPVGKGQLLGTAFTVRLPQGDNLMFHAAMDLAQRGDVIVIDAGGFTDRAIFGELMATLKTIPRSWPNGLDTCFLSGRDAKRPNPSRIMAELALQYKNDNRTDRKYIK